MKTQGTAILLILGAIAFYLCTYVVKETDQVILTQFGKPVGEPVTEAGLHFRLPLFRKLIALKNAFCPGMVRPTKCPPRIRPISLSTPTPVGELAMPCSISCVYVMNAVHCPDLMISWGVKPVMRLPNMN